jgi:hypothetical protein
MTTFVFGTPASAAKEFAAPAATSSPAHDALIKLAVSVAGHSDKLSAQTIMMLDDVRFKWALTDSRTPLMSAALAQLEAALGTPVGFGSLGNNKNDSVRAAQYAVGGAANSNASGVAQSIAESKQYAANEQVRPTASEVVTNVANAVGNAAKVVAGVVSINPALISSGIAGASEQVAGALQKPPLSITSANAASAVAAVNLAMDVTASQQLTVPQAAPSTASVPLPSAVAGPSVVPSLWDRFVAWIRSIL